MGLFTLDGHTPVPCEDIVDWAKWFEAHDAERVVAKTVVGDAEVSTVFLGLNHGFGDGPPILFETMIFGGKRDGDQYRYATWEEAEAFHAQLVEKLRRDQN